MKKKLIVLSTLVLALSSSLQAQTIEENIAALEARINTLENKVTRLESFHPIIREFSITSYQFSRGDLGTYINALNYNNGEWLYVKANGDLISDGTNHSVEICTSDNRLTSLLEKYLDTSADQMVSNWFSENTNNDITYIKSDIDSNTPSWSTATNISGDVLDYERIKLSANNSNTSVNIDVFAGDAFSFDPSHYSSFVHVYNSSSPYTATYRVGSTRQETCGF